MEAILNAVRLMKKDVENETDIFLDSFDLEDLYEMPKFSISFNGASIEIPADFAELNNAIQCFLKDLEETLEEY